MGEDAISFKTEFNLPFPVGYGLDESTMSQLGVYISNPTNYIPQKQNFSEPAWFFINPSQTVHYVDYASAPFAGRVNPEHLIMGYSYVKDRAAKEPEGFAKVVWGSVPQHKGE